ncbi:MAG: hypothetical protein LBP93_02950, partial [Treponema sp.]|nr:hypothetical protein [Treponema sp.]
MATEKKPSIYDDRGTIGSSDELDEYGVWVKSEPQDLSSMQPNNQEFIEPSIPDIEELPDFDTGFETGTNDSAAGDSRNDSFEFIDEELSIPDMAVSDDSPDTTEDTVFDEVSLDDIMASDNTEQAGLSLDSQDEQDGTRDLDGEADFTEVSIDDISQPEGSPGPEAPAEEFSDISMEDFTAVSVDDFIDSDPGASPELDMEPEPEREAPEQEAPPASGGYGEIHSMITSASDDEIFMSDFDDVEALSQDIRSSQRTPKSENPDLSTQLLMKIAEELSSIKGELSSLKSELSVIRGEESAEAAPAEQGGGRGFFDEEDDEKIALTGDELDNILNTADFTEEAGADAGESLTDDFSSLGGDEDFSSEPFPELEDSSPDLSGGLPEEPPAILSDQPDIIGSEAPEEEEKIEPDIPLETDQEESFQPEDIAAGESQEPAAFEDSIVLDEPELDELKGEHSIIGDSFDSQEFDVSFEPSLEEETDELASSDAVAEEDTGPQESDFEEISMDELTLDKDVISLDFAEDDLSEVSEEIGPDEELKEKDAEELQVLRTEGAKPMTEAPEDTSYLEEDPLAADHIDLSGAVIDE